MIKEKLKGLFLALATLLASSSNAMQNVEQYIAFNSHGLRHAQLVEVVNPELFCVTFRSPFSGEQIQHAMLRSRDGNRPFTVVSQYLDRNTLERLLSNGTPVVIRQGDYLEVANSAQQDSIEADHPNVTITWIQPTE